MAQISWRHHTLVQALLSRGPLPEKEIHSIFSCVSGKNPETHKQLFNDFLLKINKELAYLQLELRGCRNQYDGEVYYGIVNNVADEQSKLGSKYSVPQITFYNAVIEAIMQDASAQGCISNITALNVRLGNQVQVSSSSHDSQSLLPTALKSFSFSHREKTLRELMDDGWLCSTADGNIGLGMRSFLDLRNWFRSNDIPSCEVCNEAGIQADLCSKEDCTVRIHRYCLWQKFSNRKVPRICPGCGTPWNIPDTNGVAAEKENDPNPSQVSSSCTATERLRSCKLEAAEAVRAQDRASTDALPNTRKRLRSFKAEAVDTTEGNTLTFKATVTSTLELRRSKRSGLRLR